MEIKQSFLKGINRSVSRDEFFNPEFFWSTQNARVLQTGNIGEVVRINGFSKIATEMDDLDTLYDLILLNNSAIGTTNNYVAYYKDTDGLFRIRIFDDSGTQQDSFSFSSSIDLGNGELKQHSNSIYIAPHNKILYGINGNFYLRDFVSKIPDIDSISLQPDAAQKARYNLTINETVSGYGGKSAKGYIRLLNNIPSTVEDSFYVKIGSDTSDIVGPFKNLSTIELLQLISSTINSSAVFDGKWSATVEGLAVVITSDNVGAQYNNTPIEITESTLIKFEKNSNPEIEGPGGGGPQPPDGGGNNGGGPGSTPPPPDLTFRIENPSGGLDTGNVFGSAKISIKDAIVTSPIEISSTDSTADMASKFEGILSADEYVINQYDISRSGSTITLEAKQEGKEYNTNVTIIVNDEGGDVFSLTDSFASLTQTREGRDSSSTGTIEPFTNYWYTARFRFRDGHLTNTCPPKMINSGPVSPIEIVFDINDSDLDGSEAVLEIFRKEDNGEFFLIETIDLDGEVSNGQYTYVDDGVAEIEPLKEVGTVWTKSHYTHEIIDNRLVKANVKYFSDNYSFDSDAFSLSTSSADSLVTDVAPYNSKATIYLRPQYIDGSLGYFSEVGKINITSENSVINVDQDKLVSNSDKSIAKLKFYGRYLPFGEKQNLRFNTPEINSKYLGAIEDPLLFSDVTKILFGYKYVQEWNGGIYINVKGWHEAEQPYPPTKVATLGTNEARKESNRLILNLHGEEFTYVPVAKFSPSQGGTQWVYKLEAFEALQQAISTGSLNIQLKKPAADGMSKTVDDDTLTSLRVNVTGIDDKTNGITSFDIFEVPVINDSNTDVYQYIVPKGNDQRIYLVLEESKLDEIDNDNINNRTYRKTKVKDWDGKKITNDPYKINLIEPAAVAFELLNFEKKENATFDVNSTSKGFTDKAEFEIINFNNSDEAVYYLINRNLTFEDNVIYLGAKDNELDSSPITLDTTGFTFKKRSVLFYSVLGSHNIYEILVKKTDFNVDDTAFENQLIWSAPLLDNNYYSGGRNFTVTSFYNIPTDNGNIIDIVSLQGNLYAFCERGVARLLVGETLTQQKSGEVYVDNTNFIGKHIWVIEDVPGIKRDSIVKVDNAIYFTDGIDVYKITDRLENISLGFLNLDPTVEYIGTEVKKFNEYRLGNPSTGESFIFNTKYGQWYGPYTYVSQKTIEVNNKIISYINALCQEDTGNTFNGSTFTTLIQSVGNDTEIGHFMKLYRKFYLSCDNATGATFRYGKDYNSLINKPVNGLRLENGEYQIGILNSEGNTRKIYWEIESTDDNFTLSGLVCRYDVRRRR